MPTIYFKTDNLKIEVPKGTSLIQAVELANATLPFGCKMGSCGTCRCLVPEGASNLNPITDAENELFMTLTSVGQYERLGCQITVLGDVTIQS